VFALSGRQAAELMKITRVTLRYRSRRPPQDALRRRLRELAATRVRFGYRRLTVILSREGWRVNPKRIYRLYTEDGFTVRTKLRKKIARRSRVATPKATRPNEKWSMDFMSANLIDGRWLRVLTVIDQFTRECLALVADSALNGHKVALALSQVWRSEVRRNQSPSITAANSQVRRWTSGPISTVCGWNSFVLEDRPTMAISNRSLAGYAMSA
jgi:putative transposase